MAEARAIQEALRSRVIAQDRIGRVRQVAGVEASYDRTAGVTRARPWRCSASPGSSPPLGAWCGAGRALASG